MVSDLPPLSPRQAEVLAFVESFTGRAGVPPTRADIATHFGFSTRASAEEHLKALARKGYLDLTPGTARSARLAPLVRAARQPKPARLPIVGRVAAGSPILAEENLDGEHALDGSLFRPVADFLLRVRGLSMRDAGILDGDLLAVHRTPRAENGQVVIARFGDEATVKYFERQGRTVRLLPANPDFSPIVVDLAEPASAESFAVEGVCVGLVRLGFDAGHGFAPRR